MPEVLGQMASARYVITNTFHGIMLALMFRRQFVVFAVHGLRETTVGDILRTLKLTRRAFPTNSSADTLWRAFQERIDYEAIDSALAPFRRRARDYLDHITNLATAARHDRHKQPH